MGALHWHGYKTILAAAWRYEEHGPLKVPPIEKQMLGRGKLITSKAKSRCLRKWYLRN